MNDKNKKCSLTVNDVDVKARILFNALAKYEFKSRGELLSEILLNAAEKNIHKATIKLILNQHGIEYNID